MESKILNSTRPTSATSEMVDTVAYTMSRFPKLTETFILYEMIALEEAGVRVELFPLLKENQDVHHQEVAKWMERAHFYPFISGRIIAANLRYLIKKPITYLRTIFEVLFGTISSLNFFFGALGVLPKSVLFAQEMEKLGVKHLHCHFCTHPAIAGLIVFRLSGIPFSFTAHGSDLHVDQTMLGKKIAAGKRAVTISNFNKEVMVSASGESLRDKIDVIQLHPLAGGDHHQQQDNEYEQITFRWLSFHFSFFCAVRLIRIPVSSYHSLFLQYTLQESRPAGHEAIIVLPLPEKRNLRSVF